MRWHVWQIPSEQTSQERGAAWQPYCHHRNLLLSQMSPPLLQLLGHCSCIGTVVRGLPTSGTLCCSDEGNDAIRRPPSLSLHPPLFRSPFWWMRGSSLELGRRSVRSVGRQSSHCRSLLSSRSAFLRFTLAAPAHLPSPVQVDGLRRVIGYRRVEKAIDSEVFEQEGCCQPSRQPPNLGKLGLPPPPTPNTQKPGLATAPRPAGIQTPNNSQRHRPPHPWKNMCLSNDWGKKCVVSNRCILDKAGVKELLLLISFFKQVQRQTQTFFSFIVAMIRKSKKLKLFNICEKNKECARCRGESPIPTALFFQLWFFVKTKKCSFGAKIH